MNTFANFSWEWNNNMVCLYSNTVFTTLNVLLLPLFVFVLLVGFKQQRNQRTGSSSTSHSDVFTFNMVALEVIGTVTMCVVCFSSYTRRFDIYQAGESLYFLVTFGQILFHNVTCLERYLAVVHPVTYMRLKNKTGAVLRNVVVVGVWLFSFGFMWLIAFSNILYNFLTILTATILSLVSVTFFSANVLCILIRPGPGKGGRNRTHVDQSKRRAFITMMAILFALLLKFVTIFVSYFVVLITKVEVVIFCLLSMFSQFLNIPSGLVLPALYLYRAGNLHKMVKKRNGR